MTRSPLTDQHLSAGAELRPVGAGEIPWSFGDLQAEVDAARAGCGVFDLSHEGALQLVGDDTRRYANSQLTNNFRDMPVGGAARAAITDRKGRIQGLVAALLLAEDTLLVISDGVDPEWLFERLDMYIIMDPIELGDLSEERALISLQGPRAAAILAAAGAPIPAPGRSEPFRGGWVFQRDRTGLGGFDLLLPADAVRSATEALTAAGASWCGFGALEALRVLAGHPRWPDDMGERAFLHEMGLVGELVSFTKGCYIGQEVINRMETMGKLTRQLVGLELAGPVEVGAEVLLGEKSVGAISSLAEVDGRRIGLAVLRVAALEPDAELSAAGVAVELRPLTP
ncbi:MAG: hypothetical protein H6741_04125 [Alphaproteobacteria bacterium]|nr:hypothetical protein [Alphaproteobacteria bacterium]